MTQCRTALKGKVGQHTNGSGDADGIKGHLTVGVVERVDAVIACGLSESSIQARAAVLLTVGCVPSRSDSQINPMKDGILSMPQAHGLFTKSK